MAVKIRLKRMGAKQNPFYRIVVADSRYPRDGRVIETIGYYNPATTPADIKIDTVEALKWLGLSSTFSGRQNQFECQRNDQLGRK